MKQYLEEITAVKHIVITLPKRIKWKDYQKELDEAEYGMILNFKVPNFPKNIQIGKSKCYLCHDGFVKGYMIISGLNETSFTCEVTGKPWKGKFVQRTGNFYKIDSIPMKGFQGYRYFNI